MFTRCLAPPSTSFFLLGPRATGKTTWIRQHVRAAAVYDLLQASEHLRLNREPSALGHECATLPKRSWVVIDEVQRAPMLLDEVQRLMEGDRRLRFVLSGSSARKLRRGGANLLAGRAEVRHLFPLVTKELDDSRPLDAILAHGMMPIAVTSAKPRAFLKAYVETYLREEIQAEALVRQIGAFARFLEVAGRMNGQVVSVSGIARDAGVARQTVQDYFQILVDTLVGSWLPAWQTKSSNRQVAHPKFHFFDCGVTRFLSATGHLEIHPEERGFLFETFLLNEIRAFLHYHELDYSVSYWRTHDGSEVDLVVDTGKDLVAIEVKSSSRWDRRYHRGLLRFASVSRRTVRTLAVYTGRRAVKEDGVHVWPWDAFLKALWDGAIIS